MIPNNFLKILAVIYCLFESYKNKNVFCVSKEKLLHVIY